MPLRKVHDFPRTVIFMSKFKFRETTLKCPRKGKKDLPSNNPFRNMEGYEYTVCCL